ncbi:competence/damage-inducible protein A [Salipaludibacillus sp. CUR1]|uniref:competence/damage-inducible protein A n=1 Tax=Salipaludibacillus sp. CUR1 TaxID=2820003 RepID=UPI001E299635|nr:competence/damage-inducible protein A [Salipaludibacillus sp. CUR1]MCE7794536.1 competence/damage-inducible protein A [Salipaludibacillus sp. CUR1]
MNAEIIAVGSELLLGQIQNSNATYLSKELSKMGINVYHHIVVGDNPDRLFNVVEAGIKRSDLLIFTGGLGPTKDDLTKEVIAKVTGTGLVYDAETEERIQAFFARRQRVMTANNRKQALVLKDSTILPNDHGLACGMVLEKNKRKIILLPGPPNELIPMFENYTQPYLLNEIKIKEQIQSKVLRFFDIGESQLAEKVDDLIEKQTNPTIAPLASGGEVTLRLTVKGSDISENENKLEELKARILERTEDFYYGEGESNLARLLLDQLRKRKLTVAAAESLTGGQFSSALTDLPGSSAVFRGAIICYSNAVKEAELGLSSEVLEQHGAVSAICAEQLAGNVRNKLNSELGISFTGVAGPDPLEGHEPGTVFIGLATGKWSRAYKIQLAGSRENIRERAVKYGMYYLLRNLSKEKVDE